MLTSTCWVRPNFLTPTLSSQANAMLITNSTTYSSSSIPPCRPIAAGRPMTQLGRQMGTGGDIVALRLVKTVVSLCFDWWPGAESNCRHADSVNGIGDPGLSSVIEAGDRARFTLHEMRSDVAYRPRLCENYFALPMTSKNAHESSIIGNNCSENDKPEHSHAGSVFAC